MRCRWAAPLVVPQLSLTSPRTKLQHHGMMDTGYNTQTMYSVLSILQIDVAVVPRRRINNAWDVGGCAL
jgi:hypothetical protein